MNQSNFVGKILNYLHLTMRAPDKCEALHVLSGILLRSLIIYFDRLPSFFSAGETTEDEKGKLKIIWSNFEILEVAMARSGGYAN